MSDDEQPKSRVERRKLGFALSQIGLFGGAVAVLVYDLFKGSWWHFGFGVALLYIIKLRYDRNDLRKDQPTEEEKPDEEALQDAIASITKGALATTEMIQPIMEAAQGQRTMLEKNGWSPTMAESMAAQYYVSTVNRLLGGGEVE